MLFFLVSYLVMTQFALMLAWIEVCYWKLHELNYYVL